MLANLRSVKSQVYFVLQLGYFKAKHLFFTFDLIEVCKDVEYVLSQYFNNSELLSLTTIDKQTRLTQQHLIRQRFNYRSCDAQAREKLEAKAEQLASVCVKPIYIFRELIDYLSFQRIVAPGYSFMQDTIGRALDFEQKRLTTIVHNHLTHPDILALNGLLSNSEGLYEITQLKREPKEFSLSEIKREINRAGQIHLLYSLAKRLLPDMKISGESIKYYASLVSYYSVYKLKRLNKWTAYIYLLCFVYHRYQRQNDNLVNCLIYNVRRYVDEAKATAKERVYQLSISNNLNLQKAGHVLKLFTDSSIAKNTPFEQVQTKAFGILPRQKLSMIADQITTQARFDETEFQWECVDKLAHQFKRHMRPILLAVDFATSKASDPLIEAVCCLKAAFGKRKPLSQYSADTFPVAFIPESTKRYLYATDSTGNKRLLVDRYEFLIYRLVRNGIQAGDIFCRDSVRFRSFDDDLIDDKTWQNKEKLIAQTGIAILKQPILAHLATLEHQLEDRITKVNQRIISGENEHFKSKKRGAHRSWTLQYPRARELVNHPFFDTLSQVDIGRILHFVNQQCQFMEGFTHVLGRYVKQKASPRAITACLVAWGTNMGLGKMGEISDIPYQTLSTTSDNLIRLETLCEANDRISNAIAKLPIFRHYDIDQSVHSSSDTPSADTLSLRAGSIGQKFETQIPTINARYSPKYFGLKKGIVSYTLVANHIPVNAKIIGANGHESHYVFDILKNNTTDIQPQVHSTDTHGTNEVNFAILHLFGYQFAPRYSDIADKVSKSLYGFQHPSMYGDKTILPIRKINERLIIDEWENIQRIMVSLALKTTTQSIIVSKLSAYARKNKTRRALWEYDNIIRSLYLLDYIDSPPLRQNVQRALNRGENYHQLRRAISYANFGKLRFN